jgi:hypothetical protein
LIELLPAPAVIGESRAVQVNEVVFWVLFDLDLKQER